MSDSEIDVITPSKLLDNTKGENVLFLISPTHPGEWEGCMDLLSIDDPDALNVWSFGITRSPEHRIEHWHRHIGDAPGAFRIVSPESVDHSPARDLAEAYEFDPMPAFKSITPPGNLPRIGLSLRNAHEAWRAFNRQTVVCFHSICALTQYASADRVYQFLNTMTQDVRNAGALAHYHLDPTTQDPATIAKFRGLFDTIVEHPPQ